MAKDNVNATVTETSVAPAIALDREILRGAAKDELKIEGNVPSTDAATTTPVLLTTADDTLDIEACGRRGTDTNPAEKSISVF